MTTRQDNYDPVDRSRFPVDPWRLVEVGFDADDHGLSETLFTVANGHLGVRGTPEEANPVHARGCYINGFHETWPIRYPEGAYGLATTGQTIMAVPDATRFDVVVDGEHLSLASSHVTDVTRSLDFRDGVLHRDLTWRTESGKTVTIGSTRMMSMATPGLAVMTYAVSANADCELYLVSRVDGPPRAPDTPDTTTDGVPDPRKGQRFAGSPLLTEVSRARGTRLVLAMSCPSSTMTVAVAADHLVEGPSVDITSLSDADHAEVTFGTSLTPGETLTVTKVAGYAADSPMVVHSPRGRPGRSALVRRATETLTTNLELGAAGHHKAQRAWFDDFWSTSDVVIETSDDNGDAVQQGIRYNLFSLIQASANASHAGVAAKGLSGSGYEGHYFWDEEVYAIPFLTYTRPQSARQLLDFRASMLPRARSRAAVMSQRGALFPWRTINGDEASAYYPAGTAQYHIDADISYAVCQYLAATDDQDFASGDGARILVETARLYADLGFWRQEPSRSFNIYGVTGPDEYTTVVDNNMYTNVAAAANLEQASNLVESLARTSPERHAALVAELDVTDEEVANWRDCAQHMSIPFDPALGIHLQDEGFLDREVWDLTQTPGTQRPLLLHYHPLVIYRYQVLKQADTVLALYLHSHRFDPEVKRADFEYYDPLTTGDSTLSAVTQAIVGAEVGYPQAAYRHFLNGLFVDLANLHHNTVDGIHVASTGGTWLALTAGFGGMRDSSGSLAFDPRLPQHWERLTWHMTWRGVRLKLSVSAAEFTASVVGGHPDAVSITVRGDSYQVTAEQSLTVALDGHGPVLPPPNRTPWVGALRADGRSISVGLPQRTPAI